MDDNINQIIWTKINNTEESINYPDLDEMKILFFS